MIQLLSRLEVADNTGAKKSSYDSSYWTKQEDGFNR